MGNTKKNKKGFMLMDLLIAIFIMGVIMAGVSLIFSNIIGSYRYLKWSQRDIEEAQYVMNLMSKTLRTSSILAIDNDVSDGVTSINAYDYSQNKCIRYEFDSNANLNKIKHGGIEGEKDTCLDVPPVMNEVSFSYVSNMSMDAVRTESGKLGKIRIAITICPSGGCASGKDSTRIQSTVSLRDYGEADF